MKPIARVWFIATFAAAVCVLLPHMAAGQTLTGTLIGTARDEQGAAIPSGQVRISSSALIGGPRIMLTSEGGQFRFPSLPPGPYMLDIEVNHGDWVGGTNSCVGKLVVGVTTADERAFGIDDLVTGGLEETKSMTRARGCSLGWLE